MRTDRHDYSISCVRLVAMAFIILCHIMQRDHCVTVVNNNTIEWAYWFNVGVQMFLFISGYLYGKKRKVDTVGHYKKTFPKIMIDYYVFVAVVTLVNSFIPRLDIDSSTAWKFVTLNSQVAGLGHLWFVPTILFCYLTVPIFLPIFEAIDKAKDYLFLVKSILLLIVVHVAIYNFFTMFCAAWVNCYLIGILYSYVEKRNRQVKRLTLIVTLTLCFAILVIRITNEYLPHGEMSSVLQNNYNTIKQYGHVFLGIAICLLIRSIYILNLNRTHEERRHSFLDWSDKYSYDVYLVHHIFVQSAFGCVEYISNRAIALPLALALTAVFSMGLYWLSFAIKNYIAKGPVILLNNSNH